MTLPCATTIPEQHRLKTDAQATGEKIVMKEDSRQTLSALLDGESSGLEMQHAVDRLLSDCELRQCWERYHLVGHALRRERLDSDVRLMSDRVHEALADVSLAEPIAAEAGLDQPDSSQGAVSGSAMTPGPSNDRLPVRVPLAPPRWRQFAPVVTALAAAFALVAIFVIPDEAITGDPLVAGVDDPPLVAPIDQRRQVEDPMIRAKLEQLLVSHHERAPGPGLSGFVSYAAVVGHEDRN